MKKATTVQYARALYEASKDIKGKSLDEVLKSFVQILVRDHKLKKADKIIEEYISFAKKQEGVVEIKVDSARKLDAHTIKAIKSVFGDKVEAVENIDSELLGGVKIKTEDKILDASLKTQLARLKKALV